MSAATTSGRVARRVTACRSCGSTTLAEVLDLGTTPIANALLDPSDAAAAEASFPLGIQLCVACALVQVTHELPADVIFDDAYPYFSSYSTSFVQHAAEHVRGLIETRGVGDRSFVLELASNDGYLLKHFVDAGVPVLGIDAAPGPVEAALAAGVPTLRAFFGLEVARRVRAEHGPADVVIANNVMAHVPDVNDFVGAIAEVLADDGVATVENPWVKDLVERLEFDTIYHEHYCYLSCLSISALFERHGLHLNDVEYFEHVHGGTLRWWLSRSAARSERAQEVLATERRLGVGDAEFYAPMADEVREVQTGLVDLLRDLRGAGHRVAAYGAAAKGATLLNSSGIDASLVDFVADRNEAKWGKLMPGCRVPVLPAEALLGEQPEYTLLLAWNVAREVLRQQSEYVRRGGRFIIPVGESTRRPTIVDPALAS
jgi:SAM-dependent methyltransferase